MKRRFVAIEADHRRFDTMEQAVEGARKALVRGTKEYWIAEVAMRVRPAVDMIDVTSLSAHDEEEDD